jgi:hypothetical protein
MARKTVKVAVTGAAGQIGYALNFRIASGHIFGPVVDVVLRWCHSEWLRLDGDGRLETYKDIAKVVEYSEDYTKVRQTNAFAGPNWRK